MKIKGKVLILLLVLAACVPAMAQQQINGGQVQITGNGNTAYVNANNALQVELHNGSSTIGITGSSLNVNVTGGSGGTSAVDEATFTLGTTSFVPAGCYYQTTVATGALTSGQAGIAQCDADRRLFVVGAGTAGTAAGGVMTVQGASSMTPLQISPTTAANTLSNQLFAQLTNGTNGQTFMSTTTTSKYGADVNLLSILGTAPTTAGFLDIKAADGNVYVRSNAGSTFPVNATLQAGTALIGKTVPLTACGTTNYDAALQALTTSSTAITASTTCVQNIVLCNTSTSTAYTATVTDNAGTPVTAINASSIPASSCFNYPFNWTEFTSGIKWSASNVAVTGAIHGVQ
jgi:hypothetical protein